MGLAGTRVLYISYNGMLDPLGQSQVIPYLKGLAQLGVQFTLLSFERAAAFSDEGQQRCRTLHDELASAGIDWHYLRYHQTPSLPATTFDVANGIRIARRLARDRKPHLVHARAHIPAVIGLNLRRAFGTKLLFDVRGLMAEEYVDAGHWRPNSARTLLTKRMEARILRRSDGIVTLTNALWREMSDWEPLRERRVPHEVIPCCIDQQKFRFDCTDRHETRASLGISDRLVLIYSGSVGGWYMSDEMAAFFSVVKQQRPDAFFLWLTTGPAAVVDEAMKRSGARATDYAVLPARGREVVSALNAADVGIAFYRPGKSRLGTSPVKVSEYLSCGLPIVMNSGVGDCDELITRHGVGELIHTFDDSAYATATANTLRALAMRDAVRTRSRSLAGQLFDLQRVGVPRYSHLYEQILTRP